MKMEVEIISTENIKPSSPTPQHLKFFKLSYLDQLIPIPYAPLILFYPINNPSSFSITTTAIVDIPSRVNLLKRSLSNILPDFYPLAGVIKDDCYIDCNDEGARFIQARVNCHFKDFLTQPDLLSLNDFLPCGFTGKEPLAGTHVSYFQVNIFECGGMAIGICISHKILDGAALSTFLKAWSATSRGCSGEAVHPNFFAYTSDLFIPATNVDSSPLLSSSLVKKGKCITRRFMFDATAIATLKSQASCSSAKVPTRVEVVTACIWKSAMAASKARLGWQRPSLLCHLVNLRRRISSPALAENSIGNLLWIAAAEHYPNSKMDLHYLVGKLREAISKIDSDFVKKLVGGERKPLITESLRDSRDGFDYFGFSSWCRFDFYGSDFGWGKPVWVSSIGLKGSVFTNMIVLADTITGDGVEAWVSLDEEDMAILQRDPGLLSFALLDPSPLVMDSRVQC
ncbi:hypothetical protein SLE2022_173890 [Rubroshorea leprosula]